MTDDGVLISNKLDELIRIFSAQGSLFKNSDTFKKPAKDKPREVVQKETKVELSKLSDDVKKFLAGIFKFEMPELKKEITKKSSFWTELLGLVGGALVALWEYISKRFSFLKGKFTTIIAKLRNVLNKIEEYIDIFKTKIETWWKKLRDSKLGQITEEIVEFIKAKFRGWWQIFKDTKVGRTIEAWLRRFISIFEEEVIIGMFFKEGSFLSRLKESIVKFFSADGALLKGIKAIFGEGGLISKLIELIKASIETGILSKIIKFLAPFVKIFTPLFAFLEKAFWPLIILLGLFNAKKAYDEVMRLTGDTVLARMEGIITFIINILTIGFVDFDDIKRSLSRIADKFTTDNIWSMIIDGILLIPEALIKIPLKIIGWIVGIFSADAGQAVMDYIQSFSLSEGLNTIGEAIGEFIGSVYGWVVDINDTLKVFWKKFKDFFTKTIPDAFGKFFTAIEDFFNKIINFDFSNLLKRIPGYEKINNLLFGAPPLKAPGGVISPEEMRKVMNSMQSITGASKITGIAQDFISRPGQPPMHFTGQDTVLGAKAGGPIEKIMTASLEHTKKFSTLTVKAYENYSQLLQENNEMLTHILAELQQQKQTPMFINNAKNTQITLGSSASPTSFRNSVAN